MKFLFFLLLIVLVAQIGFWPTLAAVIGAFAMLVLLAAFVIAIAVIGGLMIAAAVR